jgi:hypothetical protein
MGKDLNTKIGIMQPYFIPYFGYFQLINAVDKFVIYDNIKYTKKGWINRNRILLNDYEHLITIPLKKDSDYLNIKDRYISIDFEKERIKILNKFSEAYKKAPFYDEVLSLFKEIILFEDKNLFKYLENSIVKINNYLNIKTPILISSGIDNNNEYKLESSQRVVYLCKKLNGNHYINPIGGLDLYSKEDFLKQGIHLSFIKKDDFTYQQFGQKFLNNLSVIDVLMFNGISSAKYLNQYTLF